LGLYINDVGKELLTFIYKYSSIIMQLSVKAAAGPEEVNSQGHMENLSCGVVLIMFL